MKNCTRTLLFCLLLSVSASYARSSQTKNLNPDFTYEHIGSQANAPTAITPFYTEDFAGGLPAGWQSLDSSGNNVFWHVTNTHVFNGTDSLSVVGTTAANGYMIYNSDSAQCSQCWDNADLISGPINCSTHPNVHLNFNEFFKYFNGDTAWVYVSNDGVNWTSVHDAAAGLTTNQSTANPNNVDVDISAVAANEDSVWIRFSYHANFAYYWMIDDVMLHEVAAIDGAVSAITSPLNSCPLLSANESVSINIMNTGGATMTGGFDVTYIVDGGTPVTENITDSVVVGQTFPFTFTATADFSVAGYHTIVAYITLTGDTNTSNDTSTIMIYNGAHLIDLTHNYVTSFEDSEDLTSLLFEDGNNDTTTFEINTQFPHTGTKGAMIFAPTADDWIFTTCFDLDATGTYVLTYYYKKLSSALQANLQVAIGTSQASGSMSQIIVPNSPVSNLIYAQNTVVFTVATSGSYHIGFEVSQVDSAVGFAIDDINVEAAGGVGIRNINNAQLSLYPNPSNGITYLNSNEISGNVKIDVVNTLGELVFTDKSNELKNYQIDMSKFNDGMYIVRITSDNGTTMRQVSVIH